MMEHEATPRTTPKNTASLPYGNPPSATTSASNSLQGPVYRMDEVVYHVYKNGIMGGIWGGSGPLFIYIYR
jgi:hypothetical protein